MNRLHFLLIVFMGIIFSLLAVIRYNNPIYKLDGIIAFSTNSGDLCTADLGNLILNPIWINTKPFFRVAHPNFSPDGRNLVFAKHALRRTGNEYSRIYTIAIFNLKNKKIEDEFDILHMECDYPIWSPDGRKIAFLSGYNLVTGSEIIPDDQAPHGFLYLYDLSIKEIKQISKIKAFPSNPSWLNDQELIFASTNKEIIRIDLKNKNEEKLENIHGYAPAYCSSNNKIAFRTKKNVYISNLDGTNIRNLIVSYNRDIKSLPSGYPTELVWSPDGRFLIYARQHNSLDRMAIASDLMVVNINNPKIKRKLYTGGGNFWGISWSK